MTKIWQNNINKNSKDTALNKNPNKWQEEGRKCPDTLR